MANWIEYWRIFSFIFLATTIPVAVIIVLEKRSPFKTIAWILVLILLPIVGLVFYLFFGREHRKKKLLQKKSNKKLHEINSLISIHKKIIRKKNTEIKPELLKKCNIVNLLYNNCNAPVTWGNSIKILNDGDSFFKALLHAIENANHHIHLEFYIFENDRIGNML